VGQVPDEGAVEKLAAASADPPFHDRVHAGHPDAAAHDPQADRGEYRVEAFVEGGVAVVQHELDADVRLIEVHAQVPGLLHDPLAAGMGSGAQDPVGAENLCHLGGCSTDRWLFGPRRMPGPGTIFGLWG
jgi:hypothetical protein